MTDDGSRRSLLPPVAELDLAAELLAATADALLLGREALALELMARADFPEIRTYAIRMVGKLSIDVHRRVRRPRCLPQLERDPARMPTAAKQREIFARDGWRCRFCGIKAISKQARAVLIKEFPHETRWNGREFDRHAALYAMASSLDHVVPHGRGGKNEQENFVTACYCCQFGRGEWLLSEMGLEDPRDRPPIIDAWDGLHRLVGYVRKPQR